MVHPDDVDPRPAGHDTVDLVPVDRRNGSVDYEEAERLGSPLEEAGERASGQAEALAWYKSDRDPVHLLRVE